MLYSICFRIEMKATLVLLACVCAVAVALPAVEVTKNAAVSGPNVPGLQGILLQAENTVDAVRKSRQLGLGGGLLGNLITSPEKMYCVKECYICYCLIRWIGWIWWKPGLWRWI